MLKRKVFDGKVILKWKTVCLDAGRPSGGCQSAPGGNEEAWENTTLGESDLSRPIHLMCREDGVAAHSFPVLSFLLHYQGLNDS